MRSYISFDEIEVGSFWKAADGSSRGVTILSKNSKTKTVMVRSSIETIPDRSMNWFKLQVRYYME